MTVSRAPRVTAQADLILRESGLWNNPYFTALTDGTMTRDVFYLTQEQFYFAVRYFPRPMAALIARIPDPIQRLDILQNLVEEHGDFDARRFHQNTFQRFLGTLNGSPHDPSAVTMEPIVDAFNCILMAACTTEELDVGVCCMGIIEKAFADISKLIGKAVVSRGWVQPAELVHYNLHAELDVRHADEFFAVVEAKWDEPTSRMAIQRGLRLGAYAFDQLYRGLAGLETLAASNARVRFA